MNFIAEEIERYAEAHSQAEPELLKELSKETWQKMVMPRMLSGHLQGRLLSLISHLVHPKRILEIGTYTGYSALCLAEGLAPDGELITLDINDELELIHKKYFPKSALGERIKPRYGNALEIIPKLVGNFDLVFIDADKENYISYYELVVQKMNSGGVILIDNVLWSGKVLTEPPAGDFETIALRKLNEMLLQDNRIQQIMLPIRDGLTVIRKK